MAGLDEDTIGTVPASNSDSDGRSGRPKFRAVWFVVVVAALALFGMAIAKGVNHDSAFPDIPVMDSLPGSLTPASAPDPEAEVVKVGLYGMNSYEVDVASNTFYFSGYMWMRWKGDIDPTATMEFANAVEDWGITVKPLAESPQEMKNGDKYLIMRIQGRFFQPLDMRNYPLDSQFLSLIVEDSVNDSTKIAYIADTDASGTDVQFVVPGWHLQGLSAQPLIHSYGTDFGTGDASESAYSALRFSIHLDRVRNLFLWKLLLPMLLVLVTNWLALLLAPRLIEVRTAMPATALLTTVFLQQASLDALPQVSSLVLMDYIYVMAYALIVVTFAQIIWDNNRIELGDAASLARIRRGDRISLVIQFAVAAVFLAALVAPLI
jgi:hypothetical protein